MPLGLSKGKSPRLGVLLVFQAGQKWIDWFELRPSAYRGRVLDIYRAFRTNERSIRAHVARVTLPVMLPGHSTVLASGFLITGEQSRNLQ